MAGQTLVVGARIAICLRHNQPSSMLRCTDPAGEKAWADRLVRILGEIEGGVAGAAVDLAAIALTVCAAAAVRGLGKATCPP